MIPAELLTECRDLALRIAPELAERPLYIVNADDCRPWLAPTMCCGFAAADHLDANMRDAIGGDRWQGPGPFIAIEFSNIAMLPGDPRLNVLQVLVHETAHVTPAAPVVDMSDFSTPKYRAFLAKSFNDALATGGPSTPQAPDAHHDLPFARRASHLYVRALDAGYDLRAEDFFRRPWQAAEEFYIGACLYEALKYRGSTFGEIEQMAPPPALVAGWEFDLRRYQNHYKDKS